MSHHYSGPNFVFPRGDVRLDYTDLFAFPKPGDPSKSILMMDVHPSFDVLQSVPILGYLSFTVVFFLSLFPGNTLGPELAAVFAIFTSQAWNMAFSFYQALRTIPSDLNEASRSFRARQHTAVAKSVKARAKRVLMGEIGDT